MTGPERALLYRLALTTGLRANELRSLTRTSFRLDADSPTVTVAAAYSKHRREDVIQLRQDVADALRAHLVLKGPAASAFNVPAKPAKMLRADLAAAGIPYRDDSRRVADFHGLRHTFITNLARSGVHPRVAQTLARHSTITLTMDRYTHTLVEDERTALAALPDLDAPPEADAARRTGTDDGPPSSPVLLPGGPGASGARSGAREGGLGRTSADLDGHEGKLSARAHTSGDAGEKAENCGFHGDMVESGMVRAEGLEPPTFGSVDRRSIQLSYARTSTLETIGPAGGCVKAAACGAAALGPGCVVAAAITLVYRGSPRP